MPGRRGVRGLRPAGDLAGCEDGGGASSEEGFGLDDSAETLKRVSRLELVQK